jgi:beta-galactosidase
MIPYDKLNKIAYGGDYNPEQWEEETWEDDMRLLHLAGIDTVTVNVFSWAALQPNETTYDFSKLDKIMQLAADNHLNVCMATSTGAHPAWMAKKYPDILRVDFEGRKRKFGGRHNSCPNSPTYQKYASLLAGKLAERYKQYDNIVMWHVSNEFGDECHCENCERAFQVWLQKRYGTLKSLNTAWNTSFWGHTFFEWDEIVLPDMRSEHFEYERTMFQGISLDYRRFMSDSLLNCYQLERDTIRKVIPDAVITTNLMGLYKPLNYKDWARQMDFVSWDNYPSNEASYAETAMSHDLMRGIKQGDPFVLMEQTPSVTNWLPYNALKRPGVMRLWSYQAVAHGADTVMFFQMRRSVGACEKYHGAVIDHVGTENTRVFREISALGEELKQIGNQTLGMRTHSRIALVMDWENWWAIEYSAGPSRELRYCKELQRYYEALREMNYNVDMISLEDDLSKYQIVIAPVLYMVKGTEDQKIREFVKNGGTFVTTFFSGIVQENDLVTLGGYPGKLRDILGIWVEEEDALPENVQNAFCYKGEKYPATLLCDLLHLEGAVALDDHGYETDFYHSMPVLTRNDFGTGHAYYVATASDERFYQTFLTDVCKSAGVLPVLSVPDSVEVTTRENDTTRVYFLLNHSEETQHIHIPFEATNLITCEKVDKGDIQLAKKDIRILAVPISSDIRQD